MSFPNVTWKRDFKSIKYLSHSIWESIVFSSANMSVMPMDVDPQEEEIEVPSSSTSKGDKKRFEVKKVSYLE